MSMTTLDVVRLHELGHAEPAAVASGPSVLVHLRREGAVRGLEALLRGEDELFGDKLLDGLGAVEVAPLLPLLAAVPMARSVAKRPRSSLQETACLVFLPELLQEEGAAVGSGCCIDPAVAVLDELAADGFRCAAWRARCTCATRALAPRC